MKTTSEEVINKNKLYDFLDNEIALNLSGRKLVKRIKWYIDTYFTDYKSQGDKVIELQEALIISYRNVVNGYEAYMADVKIIESKLAALKSGK
jgi:hypothetical protein